MKTRTRLIAIGAAAAVAVGLGAYAFAASSMHGGFGIGHRQMHRMASGMMGGSHDAETMAELGIIHELFTNHDLIDRTVTVLPDGIRTVTESDDARIAQLIKDHVAAMGRRVEDGRDPGLPIESDALRTIFRNYDKIETTVETTEKGVIVVQTSSDPTTVAALQQHAAEVTDFAARGMIAMHDAVMTGAGGMMHHGMGGPMTEDVPAEEVVPEAQ